MSSEKGVATVAERPVDFLCDLERSPVVSSDPHRRGPKKHRFTRTQEMLLYLIAGETVLNGGVRCTKRQLADLVGRNVKTIDRCMSALRRQGLVEAQTNFDENGAQVSNTYRVTLTSIP